MAFASSNLGALSPTLFSTNPFSHHRLSSLSPPTPARRLPRSPPRRVVRRRALREWNEYEEALKRKDLAGALRFLKSIESDDDELRLDASSSSRLGELGFIGTERDWEVLDTCLNADDMKLVANAYGFLKNRGFLAYFGKFRNLGKFIFYFYLFLG